MTPERLRVFFGPHKSISAHRARNRLLSEWVRGADR